MRPKCVFLAILVISLTFFNVCNAEITCMVVDAKTETPIEGAVVLVEWTKSEGLPGLMNTKPYKVFEALTDRGGKVVLSDDVSTPHPEHPAVIAYYSWVNKPRIVIYKKDYVSWRNDDIFPDFKKRTDFEWRDGYVFRLEPFKAEYSHYAHVGFIKTGIDLIIPETNLFRRAFQWEEGEARQESSMRTHIRIAGKVVDGETGEPIEAAVVFVKGIWSDKPLEMSSDKNGMISIVGDFHMVPDPPSLTIYKKGYVAWNSYWLYPKYIDKEAPIPQYAFPRNKQEKDFRWQDGYVFRLDHWKSESYTHDTHIAFIRSATRNSVMQESTLLKKAIEWEEKDALRERDSRNKGGRGR